MRSTRRTTVSARAGGSEGWLARGAGADSAESAQAVKGAIELTFVGRARSAEGVRSRLAAARGERSDIAARRAGASY